MEGTKNTKIYPARGSGRDIFSFVRILLDIKKEENKMTNREKYINKERIPADELFEQLGYHKVEHKQLKCDIEKQIAKGITECHMYFHSTGYEIKIIHKGNDYIYYKFNYDPSGSEDLLYYITEEESRVIHKKIEELKNGNRTAKEVYMAS